MYKLILNLAFGKMCESVRNRSQCDVVTDPLECARIIADPNFTSFTSIETGMVLLHRRKRNVVLNKNRAGGSSVLEISKKLMLSFFLQCVQGAMATGGGGSSLLWGYRFSAVKGKWD